MIAVHLFSLWVTTVVLTYAGAYLLRGPLQAQHQDQEEGDAAANNGAGFVAKVRQVLTDDYYVGVNSGLMTGLFNIIGYGVYCSLAGHTLVTANPIPSSLDLADIASPELMEAVEGESSMNIQPKELNVNM